MDMTPEELAEAQKLKPTGKRFEKIEVKSGWLWLCNPTRQNWKRFQSVIAGDQGKAPEALEQVVKDCLVKPDLPTLDSWLDEWPGQLSGEADVGPALGRLAGSTGK
jgi:hypothetical protein